MAQYQRIQVVEARKYEGPGRLPVISDAIGEQQAMPGDWLLGSERGKITVKTAADFVSEGWALYSDTPSDDQVKVLSEALAQEKSAKAELEAEKLAWLSNSASDAAQIADLSKQAGDTAALTAQVADLKRQLDDVTAQKTADEAKLAELQAHLQSFIDAQSKLQAEQEAVQKALQS